MEVEPYNESGPVRAVVFVAPPERLIRDGLPPTERYLGLLQEGAKQWGLDDRWMLRLAFVAPPFPLVAYSLIILAFQSGERCR